MSIKFKSQSRKNPQDMIQLLEISDRMIPFRNISLITPKNGARMNFINKNIIFLIETINL